MMDSLLKRIENNRKAHTRWLAMILCLSMIVSLGTFAGFRKTAVAKTYTKEVLDCPYAQEGASPVAHVHNDDCYDGDTLVCTLPEREAHTHTEECFAEQRRLTCVLEENPGHQHGDACYAAREEITCGLEENPGHEHNGTCFNESGVLICGKEAGEGAHVHTADCFTTVYDLVCDIPEGEGAHTHTDECYTTERVQVCGQEELPVHVHGPECIRTVEWNEGEDEPVVTDEPVESAVPEMPVSDPDADLESVEDWNREFENLELSGNWARDLILVAATQQGRGESPNNFEAFLNDAGDAWVRYGYTRYGAWYGVPYANEWSAMFVSFCLRYAGIPEENVPNNPTAAFMAESFQKGELFAGRDYVPAVGDLIFFDTVVDDDIVNIDHMGIVYHVDAEDGTINTVEGDRTDAVATFGYHLDDEQIVGYGILPQNPDYIPTEENLNDETAGLIVMTEEEEKNEESADTDEATVPSVPMPAQSWERTAGGIKVTVDAPEGAFPENTKIAVTPVNGNRLKDTVSDAVSGEVLEVQAVDITFFDAEGHEIEPAIPIRVVMTPAATEHAEEKTSVVHVDVAQQTAELIEQTAGTELDNSEVVFDADAFTIYAIVYTVDTYFRSCTGETFRVTMDFDENAGIPQNAELVVEEILEESADYSNLLSQTENTLDGNKQISFVRFFDISIMADGEEVQPLAPVSMKIQLADLPEETTEADAQVIHFGDQPEVLTTEAAGANVSFETSSFSVYGVVYTVDFEYEVDGQSYQFSMQGGTSITLSELIEVLGILYNTNYKSVEAFIADVESVTFSDESLLRVTRTDGDWLLESLVPFTSHEELVITMNDGKQYFIEVTDAQGDTNLNNLVSNVVVSDNGSSVENNGTVVVGRTYQFHFEFSEIGDKQIATEGTLKYTVPEGINMTQLNGNFDIIYSKRTYSGNTYTYDPATREITVHFTDTVNSLISKSGDATFHINIDGQFTGEKNSFDFGNEINKEYTMDTSNSVDIDKTGYYSSADNKVHYTVTAKSSGKSENVVVTDAITGTALTLDTDSILINGQTPAAGVVSANGDSFTANLGTLNDKETVTITYTASVDFDNLTGKGTVQQTGNTVKIKSDDDEKEKPTNVANQIDYNPLQKNAGTATGEGNTKTLPWTITVNGQQLKSVAGATITDTNRSPDVMHYSGYGISVAVMDGDRLVRTDTKSWVELGIDPSTATGWSYTLPENQDDLNNAYKYVITYNTEVDASGKVTDFNVNNTVSDNDGHQGGGSGTVPPGDDKVTLQKDALSSSNAVQSDWSISFDVPADGFSSAVLTDTFPNTYNYGSHMIDALVADSVSINGLEDEESYDIAVSNNQVVITFYKSGEKTQANQGLSGTGEKRTVTVTLSTENNPAWVEAASGTEHTNTASLNVNGQVITDTAQTFPANEGIAKTGRYQGTVDIDGKNVPIFKYTITLYGISDDSFNETGELKNSITDKYASEWLTILPNRGASRQLRTTYSEQVSSNRVEYTDRNGILTFTPKKTDFPTYTINEETMYYSSYQMDYYLRVSDDKLSGDNGILRTSLNGAVELKNEVQWDEFKDDVTIHYEYPVVDKEQTQTGRDHDGIVKYKVVLNPEKLTLNGGVAMEMQDNAQGITVDYSTIVIVAEDSEGNDVSNQVDYYYRGYTGYYTIPDNTKVTITYSARIIGDGLVTYSNDVTMKGFRDSTKKTETIHNSGGGNLNIDWVVVYKHEYQNMRKGLNGATYVLTDADGNPVVYPETANATKGFVPGEPILFTTKLTDLHTLPDGTQLDADGNVVSDGHPYAPENRDGYAWIYLSKEDTGLALQKGVTYYFKEYAAPDGYQIANTVYSFTISEHPNYDNWEYYKGDIMRLADKPVKGILEVHKTIEGADNLTDTQKKQITFNIKATDTNDAAMLFPYKLDISDNPVYITDAEAGLTISYADFVNGVYRLNNLPNGTYTVTETNAALGGYTHSETTWQIEDGAATAIASGAIATPGEAVIITDAETVNPQTHKVTYKNKYEQQEARLTIVKKGESDSIYLYGATFQLSRWDDTASEYLPASNTEFPYLTDNGEFTIDYANRKTGVTLTNLPAGRYRLVETKAPANYRLDDTPIYFTVGAEPDRTVSNGNVSGDNSDNQNLTFTAAADGKPAQYTVKNRVAHTYTLTKIDSILVAKKLNGAKFNIAEVTNYSTQTGFTYGAFSRELTTGKNGQIVIDADELELKPNTVYIVYETQAPAGYELNRKMYAFWIGANESTIALYHRIAADYNKDGADGISYVNLAEGPQVSNVPNKEKSMDLFVKKLWYGINGAEWNNMPPSEWGIDKIEVRLMQQTIDAETGDVISEKQYPDNETTFFLTKGGGGHENWLDYKWEDLPTGQSVNTETPVTYKYYVEEINNNDFQAYYILSNSETENQPAFKDSSDTASDVVIGDGRKSLSIINTLKPLNYTVKKVWLDDENSHNSVNVKLKYSDKYGTGNDPTDLDLKDPKTGVQYKPNINLESSNNWTYNWGYIYPGSLDNPRTYYVEESNLDKSKYTSVGVGPNETGLFVMTNTKTTSDKLQVKKVWLNEDGTQMSEAPDTPVTLQLQKEEGIPGAGHQVSIQFHNEWGDSNKTTITVADNGSLSFNVNVGDSSSYDETKSILAGGNYSNGKYSLSGITEDCEIYLYFAKGWANTPAESGITYKKPEITWTGMVTDVTFEDGILDNGSPAKAQITLPMDGNNGQWAYQWQNLTAPTGKTYRYSVREFPVPVGYDVSYENNDGITTGIMYVKNTKSEYTRAMAYKKWLNADGTEIDVALDDATVTFTLYQDGRRVKDVVLDGTPDENGEDTAWTAVWEGLEVINKRTSAPHVYTVKETSGFTGYAVYRLATDEEITANEGIIDGPNSTMLIAGDGDTEVASGETIYNKKARSLTVTKAWQDEQGDTLTDIPEGTTVTIGLYKAGETTPVKTIKLDGHADVNGESPAWVANFTNLEDNAAYIVKEESAPSGFTLVSTRLNNNTPVTVNVNAAVTLETGDNTVVYTNKEEKKETGSLSITKNVTVNGQDTITNLADGAYVFSIAGPDSVTTVVKYVQITVTSGKMSSYKVADGPDEPANWTSVRDSATFAADATSREAVVDGLAVGDYIITETPVDGMTTTVSGGKDSQPATEDKSIIVTVTAGETVAAEAKVTFINDKSPMTSFNFNKIWLGQTGDISKSADYQPWQNNITVTIGRRASGTVDPEFALEYTISAATDSFEPNTDKDQSKVPTGEGELSALTLTGSSVGNVFNFKLPDNSLRKDKDSGTDWEYFVKEIQVENYAPPKYGTMDEDDEDNKVGTINVAASDATDGGLIVNQTYGGYALPQTGGIGTILFTALGGLMTATAGAILTMKSYRRRKENA